MKMYALKHVAKDILMGVATSSNDGSFCVGVEHVLDTHSGNVWVVLDREIAEKAAVTDTDWFNAGYNTPGNKYIDQLEVVELAVA